MKSFVGTINIRTFAAAEGIVATVRTDNVA